mmetsp:Transcript_23659/g.59963  ORF Transcript_23659/g.59963 Transcript_23659/m.59963 type:complete len:548 (+) Transcript_23659:48-1691(+)
MSGRRPGAYTGGMGMSSMLKEGSKHFSGVEEATLRNIAACKELAQTVRTSLGPNGMNKMVINHLEKLFVTSDSATILKELEVQHPAARLLVLASKMQEEEMGDGTNLVVILAGELLVKAEELLHTGVHTSEIIAGYNKAAAVALKALEEQVCHTVDDMHDPVKVAHAIRSVIASKQYGLEDFVAPMIAKACVSVMPADGKLNVDNIRVAKILGGVSGATDIVRGMVLPREPLGVLQRMDGAKIAVYGCPIDSTATETKGTVLIKSAEELMNYTKSEEAQMEATIKSIADAGVNVVICGQTIGEIAMHFLNRFGILALKTPSKFELRRICRTVGANALVRLEAPSAEDMGSCETVYIREIGSTKCTILDRGDAIGSKVTTIVVRGSTGNILDDLERTIEDGVSVVKAMCTDARFVAGGGACEMAVADALHKFGAQQPGLDQYAITKFAESMEVVPRTLSDNAGLDATNMIANLYAGQNEGKRATGIDIEAGEVGDMAKKGVYDLLATKLQAFKLASDAAITVLRVDQIIMAKQAGGAKPPPGGGGGGD